MIGVLGGTFDPVHIGHLRLAIEAQQSLALEKVVLVPLRQPPHRDAPVASPDQRLAMLEAAVQDLSRFEIDRRELARPGPSYTIDTLVELRQLMPGESICLLMGMDAFAGLTSWRRWNEITEYAHLVIMPRPGINLPEGGVLTELVEARGVTDAGLLRSSRAGSLWFGDMIPLAVSATVIRQSVSSGHDIRYLVPEPVKEMIRLECLYQDTIS